MAGQPSTGAYSPIDATRQTLHLGEHHVSESSLLCFIKNIYGAMLLAVGSLMSLVLSTGFPGAAADNPVLPHLLQGFTFPIGLILVYLTGAELYTGYPMWQTLTLLSHLTDPHHKRIPLLNYPRTLAISWAGNLLGALAVSYFLAHLTGTLAEEPHHSGLLEQLQSQTVDPPFYALFLRALGCGWLVTTSMFLGTQQHDGVSKALALHLPFWVSTTVGWPHTVEVMFMGTAGMMEGAEMGVGTFLGRGLIPVTLGNFVGGALTGLLLWWIFEVKGDDQKRDSGEEEGVNGFTGGEGRYRD